MHHRSHNSLRLRPPHQGGTQVSTGGKVHRWAKNPPVGVHRSLQKIQRWPFLHAGVRWRCTTRSASCAALHHQERQLCRAVPPGAPAVPRSARQQNEQARPVPNREDRSIVKLKILLQSWFPLRIRVLPNSGRPSGLLIGLAITVRRPCSSSARKWRATGSCSRCSRTAGFRRRHLAQHERLDRTPRVQARKRARTRTNSYARMFTTNDGRAGGSAGRESC